MCVNSFSIIGVADSCTILTYGSFCPVHTLPFYLYTEVFFSSSTIHFLSFSVRTKLNSNNYNIEYNTLKEQNIT